VVSLPGPSAPLALLACAGLPTHRFTFFGFLPTRSGPRRRLLADVRDREETLVFFETARRLAASLADMAEVLGPRRAVLGRELTKAYEEIIDGDLSSLSTRFGESPDPKGEIVVAVAGRDASSSTGAGDARANEGNVERRLRELLDRGSSVSDAARQVASELGVARRDAYRHALALRSDRRVATP